MPDNNEFEFILKQKRVKVMPKDFDVMERYFQVKLEEANEMIDYYQSLLHEAGQCQNSKATLMLEIISGSGIHTENDKYMPFIEVTQSWNKNNQVKFLASGEMNTTKASEKPGSFANSLKKSNAEEFKNSIRSSFKNELVLSTDLPMYPNENGVFEWSKLFELKIDQITPDKNISKDNSLESLLKSEKSNWHNITLNLYRAKKNKWKAQKLGQSRSFYTLQFKNQEVSKLVVDFKDDYESKSQGKIAIRTQYIPDKVIMFSEIINAFK